MDRSDLLEKQGNCSENRRWRRIGDVPGGDGKNVRVSKLRPKQEEAIIALLTRSVEDAARAVKIAPRTLYRWMNQPEFDKAFRKARRTAFGQGAARLQRASGAAVSSVLKIMIDQQTPASTKLRAADLVLTQAKAIEIEDIEARVAELEAAAASGNHRR